ncbi:hypothetical protein [Paenibacillus glacialis]|uniref:Uncharacterized protein n=1 Tax=Paenibacillus glacialis TaxID=494026 RepID=A0A168DF65_9BACL|nr:hypothetical protein [Paenibacillus glacialis]OAB34141.1 hypothetical protein PGLA_24920 [Paenibacillus glacialis]
MLKDTRVKKSEIIQLLDKGQEFEQAIFDNFSGEEYAGLDEYLNTTGIKNIFDLLIPRVTWTKEDYTKKNSEVTIIGTETDENGFTQLIIGLDGVTDTFTTTSEAIGHLFTPIKMIQYAKYLLDDSEEHLELLLYNFNYWFKEVNPNDPILIRTVVEDGKRIVRCFATAAYKPIDNHVLYYTALWALEQLDTTFRLALPRISHSSMKLDFISDEELTIDGIGKLSYGFTLVNSEDKSRTVGFYPTFDLVNNDGTSATLIMDKPITIVHRGKTIDPIIRSLEEIKDIKDHLTWVISVIKIAHKTKIDDIFAYRVQQEIISIIGKREFDKFSNKFTEISSNNTFNLLQFFGRLNEMNVSDEDQAIKVKVLFWKFLEKYKKDKN